MDPRTARIGLVGMGLAVVLALISGDGGSGVLPIGRNQLTARYEADGRVLFGRERRAAVIVPQSRAVRTSGSVPPWCWRYIEALRARLRPLSHTFEVRQRFVVTVVSHANAPWRAISWMVMGLGAPRIGIPTVRFAPRGHASLVLPLPQDPGLSDSDILDPPHVHVSDDEVRLYDGGVFAGATHVTIDADESPKLRFRSGGFNTDALAPLASAVQDAMAYSDGWAFGRVALTWSQESKLPFHTMVDIIRRIQNANPETLFFSALAPGDIHGR